MITKDDVKKIAGLSSLTLADGEIERLAGQLSSIFGYVETLNTLKLEGVEPTSHAVSVSNVFREDEARLSGIIDDAIKSGPEHEGRFFRVPKVIE
jgi:aspartyl-tRNA(Asn)/glutamyl-tRNA(Gln) amidotransferase subunit C